MEVATKPDRVRQATHYDLAGHGHATASNTGATGTGASRDEGSVLEMRVLTSEAKYKKKYATFVGKICVPYKLLFVFLFFCGGFSSHNILRMLYCTDEVVLTNMFAGSRPHPCP